MGVNPDRSLALHEYAKQLIPIKARQLIGKAGYRRADIEDIEQDLFLYLHEHTDDYDSGRGAVSTFIARIVDARIAMKLRERRRKKRAAGFTMQSLDVPVTGENGKPTPLADLVTPESRDRITGTSAGEGLSLEDREAFKAAFDSLTPEEQDVLLRRLTRAEYVVAADLDISRRQLAKVIAQIREQFKTKGFGES